MNNDEKWERINELTNRAISKYIDCIEWHFIIDMLNDDDRDEYYKLIKEVS